MSAPGPAEAAEERGHLSAAALWRKARFTAPHQLPGLIAEQARLLGAEDATIFVVDLQQVLLVPFLGQAGPDDGHHPTAVLIDSTVAGRVYQQGQVTVQVGPGTGATVWLPLCEGANRLGVLSVSVRASAEVASPDAPMRVELSALADTVAALLAMGARYSDSVVVAARTAEMGLAAEIQWGLLPPLTFTTADVSIAAILEPAYDVAGDSVDYAVEADLARLAVFDAMGHGLRSAQMASLSVAAYRNARRSGRSLTATAVVIDRALAEGSNDEAYSTAVLAELDTRTGLLSWINAGHPEPLLLRRGRFVRSLHVDPCLPFGLALSDIGNDYTLATEQLEPGDQVIFCTDGVTDAHSPSGDLFGVDRLIDLLTSNVSDNLSTAESIRRVGRALLAHQQAPLTDDATLLLLQWPGSTAGKTLSSDGE
jgi:serine phosphatase RsbU (regulator of sigma subunit)